MGHRLRGALRAALLSSTVAAAATVALRWAAPGPSDALALLRDVDSWSGDPAGAQAGVVALVSLGAEACVAWLYLGALLTAAGALPGGLGRLAAAAARRLVPGALRQLLQIALGVGIATSSLAAGVALPAAAAPTATAATGTALTGTAPTAPSLGGWPQLDWPGLVDVAPTPAPDPAAPSAAPGGPDGGAVRPEVGRVPQVPAPIVAPAPVPDDATPAVEAPGGSTPSGPPPPGRGGGRATSRCPHPRASDGHAGRRLPRRHLVGDRGAAPRDPGHSRRDRHRMAPLVRG